MTKHIYKDITIAGDTENDLRRLHEILDHLGDEARTALLAATLQADSCALVWFGSIPAKCDLIGFEMQFTDGDQYIHITNTLSKVA